MQSLSRRFAPPITPEDAKNRKNRLGETVAEWPLELDLERLVWDPEYRVEMRAKLRAKRSDPG